MYPHRLVSQALRLGLLVTVLVLALSACGGGEKEANKAHPLPEDQKALRPGTYHSEEFKPSLSFRVGKGWKNVPPELPDNLVLTRGAMGGVGFTNVQEVFKPTKTGTPNVVEAPKDMVGWFEHHPYLQTDKPEPVTVGGVKGEQFDVVVAKALPKEYSGLCSMGPGPNDCVDLFRLSSGLPGGLIAQYEGDKVRVIVLEDVKGKTVTIGIGSRATTFDEFLPKAQKVLDSVKWRGS